MNTSSTGFVWFPDDEVKRTANWTALVRFAGVADYPALAARASADPERFWNELIRFLDFRFYKPYQQVRDLSRGLPFTRWCVGGTTNLVLNALDKKTSTERAAPAVIWEGEDGSIRRWTYDELDAETCRIAAGLASLGLKQGDVIGLYLPLVPEAVAAFLAIAKLGCVVLPLFSGFGPEALATRLQDGGAVALITVDGTLRRGQKAAMKTIVDQAAAATPALRHVVVVRRLGIDTAMTAGRDHWWHALTEGQQRNFPTVQVDAEHTLMVIYTSGTTGRPKGIVHTHCGFGVKAGLDTQFAWEFRKGERVMWQADFGWLAGPLLTTGCMLAGATLVLAEGAPDYPEPGRYWRLIRDHRVNIVGIGPTLARGMRRHGNAEVEKYDLSSLRIVLSSGEPWDRESWMWVFEKIGNRRVPIMNTSGGTEICNLVATNILYPIKPGCFHGGIPGGGADIVDAQGQSVGPGEVGELVMREACIGTTRGLWKDPDRYLKSYWEQIPGMWVQGDWASRDVDGCWFLHGRSDDTIKVAGKRTGPAELEEILLGTKWVSEAAVIGVPDAVKGAAVVCVVVPMPGETPDNLLSDRLSRAIVNGMGASFRPRDILFVNDLPKTRTMKVMRRVVRSVITGDAMGDLSSLANPDAVDNLKNAVAKRGGV